MGLAKAIWLALSMALLAFQADGCSRLNDNTADSEDQLLILDKCLCSNETERCNLSNSLSENKNLDEAVAIFEASNITEFECNNSTCKNRSNSTSDNTTICVKMLTDTMCTTRETTRRNFTKCDKCLDINRSKGDDSVMQSIIHHVCIIFPNDLQMYTTELLPTTTKNFAHNETETSSDDSGNKSKTPLILGLSIGIILLTTLVIIVVFVVLRRKQQKRLKENRNDNPPTVSVSSTPANNADNLQNSNNGYEGEVTSFSTRGANSLNRPDLNSNFTTKDVEYTTVNRPGVTEPGSNTVYCKLGERVKNITDPYDALDTHE